MSKQRKKPQVKQMPEPYRSIFRRVSTQDRKWFEEHKGQTEYFRPCVPGEFYPEWRINEPLPDDAVTHVCQIVPGQRTRQPVKLDIVIEPKHQTKSA